MSSSSGSGRSNVVSIAEARRRRNERLRQSSKSNGTRLQELEEGMAALSDDLRDVIRVSEETKDRLRRLLEALERERTR